MVLKRLTAVLLIVCMMATFMPTAFAATQNFKDFPTGWSKEAMTAAVNNGLLVGVNATEIRPTANLTRAELATIVVRAFGAETTADISSFKDVPKNAWYYDYIAKAVKMEALNGKSDTIMDPLSPITREEVFTVLSRILVLESDNSSVLSKFNDKGEISDWAVKGLSALVEKGYVNGDDLGNLNPKANITREEFAQFMHNMIKVYITKPGIYTEDLTGITVLRVGGVTIKNMKQVNDLVAGDGVMFEDVKLEDVEIVGRLLARGGKFTLKRTTVSENVVVKNVNGVVHFNNYRDEKVFENINEITKATFLVRGGVGGGVTPPTKVIITFKDENGNEVQRFETTNDGTFGPLPAIPVKPGHTPIGWFIEGTNTKINEGDKVPPTGTVIVPKYQINKHNVTFKLDGGIAIADGKSEIVVENVEYGKSILSIAPKYPNDFKRDDYSFTGWKREGTSTLIDSSVTLGDAPETYVATWSQTHALYTVKHIRQDLNGNYDETNTELCFTEQIKGEIGKTTTAKAKTEDAYKIGFTVVEPIEQVVVTADANATVIIKYKRNVHKATFVLGNGEADISGDYMYGTPIDSILPTNPTRRNYEFTGWDPEITPGAVLGDNKADYTAQWKKTHSDYVVKHFFENLEDDGFTFDSEVPMNGEIGKDATYDLKNDEGFRAVVNTVKIPETDDLVVEIKYYRITSNVTFKFDNGDADKKYENVKYGTFIEPLVPTGFKKQGYVFDGWDNVINSNTTLGIVDLVYTAQWKPGDAKYTVKHYREDLEGNYDENNSKLYFEEELDGITGEKTQATAIDYEGFKTPSVEQVDVLADGSAVVEIYYERKTYKVTFAKDNGEEDVVYQYVKFEEPIKPLAPTGFEKEGFVFDKWSPEIDDTTTMPHVEEGFIVYTAQWIPEKVTVRFLHGKYGSAKELDKIELDYGTTVEKDKIDSQKVYEKDLYSYVKKSSYAPFYNNETHLTYSDYWYINDNGEWEQFDEKVVVKKDIDVYAWFNYFKVQLTVPQLTSLAPPLLVTYTPDGTRIMDTAKDLLYAANNTWVQYFVGEDKYLELREKAFEKAAKSGVIDEIGQIKVATLPVKITSVIKPEDIHKEVKKYIRDIITNEDKLEQIFGMVTPGELVTLIGPEKLLGMLTNQQIADIINGMPSDDIVDLIIDYPDVTDIVIDALKDLITPDDEGNVPDLELRNKVIAQIEHQLAADPVIRKQILGDLALLDWVLTSFEDEIEDFIVTDNGTMDDEFIRAILSNGTIRVSMIEKLLTKPAFVEVLKGNALLKSHLIDTIRGDIKDDILAMLDPSTGNDQFKAAILNEIKGNSELFDSFDSTISNSLIEALAGYGTSAELKAYALHVVNLHYGNTSSYTGTDYSGVISNQIIEDKILEAETEIKNSDLKAYVLDIANRHYGNQSEYNGTDYSDIIPESDVIAKIQDAENEIRNSAIKDYVLDIVKVYYGATPEYDGEDYSGVISDSFIEGKIQDAENEIRNSAIKEYVLDFVKVHYGATPEYTGEDYSSVIPDSFIEGKIIDAENEIRNSAIKDYVLDFVKVHYGATSEYDGEDYSNVISNSFIEGKIQDAENEIRNSQIKDYVLDLVKVHYGATPEYTGTDYSDIIPYSFVEDKIAEVENEITTSDFQDYVIHIVNKEYYGNESSYGGEDYSNIIDNQSIINKLMEMESEIRAEYPGISDDDLQALVLQTLEDSWEDILSIFMAEVVINSIEDDDNWNEILDSVIPDAVIEAIDTQWDDILDSVIPDAVIEAIDTQWDDILDSVIPEAVIETIDTKWDDILNSVIPDAVIETIDTGWDDMLQEYMADAVITAIDSGWDEFFGEVTDEYSIAYKVDKFKKDAVDAFIKNDGDLSETDYAAIQGMVDETVLTLIVDFVNGVSYGYTIEGKITDVMMDFALQDVDKVNNQDVKELLTTAQNKFKEKAKALDTDTIVAEFISFRDEDPNNPGIIKQVISGSYADIIEHVESSLFDDEGNLNTEGEIYKSIDKILAEEAENIPYDTFAGLLNMLLENDSDLISGYFTDFVENPDNRDIVREQVEIYIAKGNIDADFVDTHRAQIENALTNEGIDITSYITVDVIKTYINSLGNPEDPDDDTAKIAFADKVYEALEQVDEYKEFMSSFDEEKDTFVIHEDNTLFVMGIAEAIKSFSFESIIGMVDNKLADKVIEVFGEDFLKELFEDAQNDYYQGIVDIVDEIEAEKEAGLEPKTYEYKTALTFKVDFVAMLRKAYDKGTEKAYSILNEKGINYTENQYLNYLITNDYLAEILYYNEGNKYGEYTGYELKTEEEYADMVLKYAILLDDAICWYGDNLTEDKLQSILSAVLTKTFNLHDKLNELLEEYRATGNLPERAENLIEGVEQVNKMFTKFQPKLDKVIDKYLASRLNQEFEPDDVLGKDKVQTGLDIMLGTDDPTFTIDFLYELFYRYDDKAQGKLKQLIDSGKLEKAVKKFEETELVKLVGKFTDNSRVTSLAEKAEEIKNSGKVKTAFNSIYDLLVLISEYGIEPFKTDEDVVTVVDAYQVEIKGITLKIAREFNT